MRRRISLYIDGALADLSDESFILMNFTQDEMQNPTVVKNSYSNSIELPATPANDAIFSYAYRLDRHTSSGGFDPLARTPFEALDETGELLLSGYLRLDRVKRRNGRAASYTVTLFGGLGSVYYLLSYGDDGNKLTLADLNYLNFKEETDQDELDFTINAQTVLDCWEYLDPTKAEVETLEDVITFVPAYEGIPDGDFDASRGLLEESQAPVGTSYSEGSESYGTIGNYLRVNLAQPIDEWAAKDLRSYLQRPALSMRSFWVAVDNYLNHRGYRLDYTSVLTDPAKFAFGNTYLTLPLIPSLGERKKVTSATLALASSSTSNRNVGRYTLSAALSSGDQVTAVIHPVLSIGSLSTRPSLNIGKVSTASFRDIYTTAVFFIQAVAYDGSGRAVGGSAVKCISFTDVVAPADLARELGFTPDYAAEFDSAVTRTGMTYNAGRYESDEMTIRVDARNVAYYDIMVTAYTAGFYVTRTNKKVTFTNRTGGTTSVAPLYNESGSTVTSTGAQIKASNEPDAVTIQQGASLRSGAVITKRMLLSTAHTPAEYLVSFCRLFGLYLDYDQQTKTVRVLRRNDIYTGDVVDLTGRIDSAEDVDVVPYAFDSRWYAFAVDIVKGGYASQYLANYGRDYGEQRVDTGYSFNSETVDFLAGNAFRSAVTMLDRGNYWFFAFDSEGDFWPSPFFFGANTYTLFTSPGLATHDFPVPQPDQDLIVPVEYNGRISGYDIDGAAKCEFRDASGKAVDGQDVLVMYDGEDYYSYFKVSDDIAEMDTLNAGKPCWILDAGEGVNVPRFRRLALTFTNPTWAVVRSLDFGVPAEIYVPQTSYPESASLYAKAWKAFLHDRYDRDSMVMTCRVRLDGLQVGPDLLRRFYYYGGSIWSLNKISNYSLTTFDPVECEFTRVQDIAAYTAGQELT